MDLFGTESKIEEIESDVEETTERLEEVQSKENRLQDAVKKLQGDIETSNILKERIAEKEEDKKELLEKIDEYKSKVRDLEDQINEAISANEESASILHSLELLGEDVQEGLEILADRQLMIEKCKEQLTDIMEKLNMAASFNESSSGRSSESAPSYNTRNQILACDHDPCIDRFGWKAKQREFSLEDDLKQVNPGYYTGDMRRTHNCQRCVVAFEARLRGADVIATDRILDGTDTLPYMNDPNGWPSCFEDHDITPCFGNTGLDSGIKVIDEMHKYGEGARAIVALYFHNTICARDPAGNKHVLIVDTSNGTTVLRDQLTRVLVDPSTIFPQHDFSEGIAVTEKINPTNPRVKEVHLVSKKSGQSISIVRGGGGHAFTAMQKGGKTVFCDPQTGMVVNDPQLYFVNAISDMAYVMRIDNLAFTERAKDCCQSL